MSNVSMDATFDGTVFRRRSPSGEKSWRLNLDGTWAVCLDHKGPWVSAPVDEVPNEIIEHLIDFRATMLGTTVEQEREFFAAHPHGLSNADGRK